MSPREGKVTVCRLAIHYLDWAAEDGEEPGPPATRLPHSSPPRDNASPSPLLLLHGFLDHAWSFEPFVRCFREQSAAAGVPARRIVAIDLRGHGDSGWVQGGYYHFPDYVIDVMGVADALGIGRFALLGHSMGSMAASLVAGAFPDRIEHLILVEGLGPPDMKPDVAPERFRQWVREVEELEKRERSGMDSVRDAAERLQRTHRRLSPELALFLAEKGTRRRSDGRVEWKHDPLHRTRSPQPFYLAQAEAFWRRIPCPVLFITGAESEYHFFNDQERRKRFADGRGVDIEGAGHMIHHDRPDRLAEEVLAFLHAGDRAG